jgi:hypothetical protein
MNFISEKPSWPERVALGRIATSTLCVSAVRLRCSSRDLTWVTLSQRPRARRERAAEWSQQQQAQQAGEEE